MENVLRISKLCGNYSVDFRIAQKMNGGTESKGKEMLKKGTGMEKGINKNLNLH